MSAAATAWKTAPSPSWAIGEEVTIKHFWKEQDRIILKAANPDVADRVFTAQEAQQLPISVLGRVLFCKRYF